MTDLRTAAQQALEALGLWATGRDLDAVALNDLIYRLEAALAEPVQELDLSRCPKCGGPADNGHDRSIPPNPYHCTKCMAEPATLDEAMAGPLSLAKAYENGWNAAKAEPVQEPVAWYHVPHPGNGSSPMVSLSPQREPSMYAASVPLYLKEQL